MPSRVTFGDVTPDNRDLIKPLSVGNHLQWQEDEAQKHFEEKTYQTLDVASDDRSYGNSVIDDVMGDDTEQERQAQASRMGKRQSIAAQIFNPWGQEYRKRISLHGKAIYFTAPSKRKSKHRKMKFAVYTFLERPNTQPLSLFYHFIMQWQMKIFNFLEQPKGLEVLYHLFMFALVFGCLILSVLATIPEYDQFSSQILFWLEIVILILFSVELVLRLWSAGCRCRYQGFWGILRFCRKPFCIIDIVVIFSSFIVICAGSQGNVFAATAMRSLRFLQILRMVRMDRRGGTWKLLSSVVRAHSKELFTAWYIGFLTLIFASFLVYQAEKDANQKEFQTYADALWWGLVTLTTIGYGDKVPKTWVGRLIASGFTILGISFFALPAGILGSGFALKVQEQHRQKHFARRRMPAAYLIQCMWRCYAADPNSRSVATWLPHLRARLNKKKMKDTFRNANSPKFSRKSTFRHRFGAKSSVTSTNMIFNGATSPTSSYPEVSKSQSFAERLSDRLGRQNSVLKVPRRERSCSDKKILEHPEQGHNTDDYDDYSSASSTSDNNDTVLSEQHKSAMRSIRMMKFLVAKRKFKETLRPYDVKDVIEQYSSGHVEMLARIKNLQNRVDMILGINSEPTMGNPPSYYYRSIRTSNDHHHCHNSTSNSMNSRLAKVESDVENVDKKLELILHLLNKPHPSPLVKRREKRLNGKKEGLIDPRAKLEPLNDVESDEQSVTIHTRLVTGANVEYTERLSPKDLRSQIRENSLNDVKDDESMEFLPASAWDSSLERKDHLDSPGSCSTSCIDSMMKDNDQTHDATDCETASMDSVHCLKVPTCLELRSVHCAGDVGPLSCDSGSFTWQNGDSTCDNAHHEQHPNRMKSSTSEESFSFRGTEESSASTVDTEKSESSMQATRLSWSKETSDFAKDKSRAASGSDQSVIIKLSDLDVGPVSTAENKVQNCCNVPTNSKISTRQEITNQDCPISTSETKLNAASLFSEATHGPKKPDVNSRPFSQNNFVFSYPTSCADIPEESIALTTLSKPPALDNRCSLPLAQIADFSSSSEVV